MLLTSTKTICSERMSVFLRLSHFANDANLELLVIAVQPFGGV